MITIEAYQEKNKEELIQIWNQVVEEGMSFPQEVFLNKETAEEFFRQQSYIGVAREEERILGFYILHPNNVGRCGHIANASYCVERQIRGKGTGRILVQDSLEQCRKLGFHGLQFNAVVASNIGAIHLYDSLGFTRVGTVPGGFRVKGGKYEDIILFYKATNV